MITIGIILTVKTQPWHLPKLLKQTKHTMKSRTIKKIKNSDQNYFSPTQMTHWLGFCVSFSTDILETAQHDESNLWPISNSSYCA